MIEESFWSEFAMPLANVADVRVEWIPYRPTTQLVLASKVGNTVTIAVSEDTERVRALIGHYVSETPLARWLSDATRDALMLEGREAH